MTSANFQVSYASVATALFDHIEQDLLLLTTAVIDDDDASSFPAQAAATGPGPAVQEGTPPP